MENADVDLVNEVDGFAAIEYNPNLVLSHLDTVWVVIPGLADTGVWMVVDEDCGDGDPTVSARAWNEQYPVLIQRANIKHEMIHSCECGAWGSTSWRICHPDA